MLSVVVLALSVASTSALLPVAASPRVRYACRASRLAPIMQEDIDGPAKEEAPEVESAAAPINDGGPTMPPINDGGPTMPVSSTGDKIKGLGAIVVGLGATGAILNYAFSPGSIFESPAMRNEPTANERAVQKYTSTFQQAVDQ